MACPKTGVPVALAALLALVVHCADAASQSAAPAAGDGKPAAAAGPALADSARPPDAAGAAVPAASAASDAKVAHAPNAFAVRYMMRDMETIAGVLQLDSTQTSIVEAMLGDYLAESSVSRPASEYPKLAEQFRANVQAVLSEEQFLRWPDVDAAVRRSRLSVGATLPGEGVDAMGLVSGMLEPQERVSREVVAASAEYTAALDPLLGRRTELLDAIRARSGRSASAEALRALVDELGPLRAAIRDLNARTVEHVASLLAPGRGAVLADAMSRAAYPSVYSAGEAESLVRRAREEAAADSELHATIDVIAGALELRLAEARGRAIDAVRARSEFAAGIRGSMSPEQVDEQIKRSESELMQVDDWVMDALVVEMPERTSLGAYLRQELDARDQYRRLRDANAWGNKQATVAEFDSNGDGQLDASEADMVFRTYTRNVSRFAKYRL
jgi:hypothetical protein